MEDVLAMDLHRIGVVADGGHDRDFHAVGSIVQPYDFRTMVRRLLSGVVLGRSDERQGQAKQTEQARHLAYFASLESVSDRKCISVGRSHAAVNVLVRFSMQKGLAGGLARPFSAGRAVTSECDARDQLSRPRICARSIESVHKAEASV